MLHLINEIWDYSEANAPFLDEMGTDHVTALDGEHHRDKRTILKPAFDQAPAMRFLPEFQIGYAGSRIHQELWARLVPRR